jgi:ankyrin repeat domain-containing protein 50
MVCIVQSHQLKATSSAIIDGLRHRYGSGESTAVLYFYFATSDRWRVTDQNLLSSLLVQMCNLVETIPNELAMLSNLAQGQQPSFELLFRAVAVAMQGFQQIFIVIDALDECSDSRRLIPTLQSMIAWDLAGLHLFLSSRPYDSIQALLKRIDHSRYINITDFNRHDIEESIHQKLSKQLDYWPESLKYDVERAVVAKADGL